MTNEQAISIMKIQRPHKGTKEKLEAYDMATKALEQQPCDDCISREAVEKITWEEPSYTDALNVLAEVRDKIRQLPSVTPQPQVGEWLKNGDFCKCSNCHHNVLFSAIKCYKYCPSCGSYNGGE